MDLFSDLEAWFREYVWSCDNFLYPWRASLAVFIFSYFITVLYNLGISYIFFWTGSKNSNGSSFVEIFITSVVMDQAENDCAVDHVFGFFQWRCEVGRCSRKKAMFLLNCVGDWLQNIFSQQFLPVWLISWEDWYARLPFSGENFQGMYLNQQTIPW